MKKNTIRVSRTEDEFKYPKTSIYALFLSKLTIFIPSFGVSLLVFYFYMGGFSRLDPRNFQWISGDNSLSYISQLFYLSDRWRFPLGLNPNYGLELSTSLTYTSPPLPLMLVHKILRLPPEFQFIGLWLLCCLFFQIFFGAKLSLELGARVNQSIVFGILQVTPFLLMRMQIHYWLSAHFIILWTLMLLIRYIKSKRIPYTQVILLLILSYTIHGYLLLFALLLLFVILILDFKNEFFKISKINLRFLLVLFLTPLTCIILIDGTSSNANSLYEKIRMNFTGQYSFYPSNLLAPINPQVGFARDCSKYHCMFGSDIPDYVADNFSVSEIDLGGVQGNEDGFLYLGLGLIFFIFCMLFILILRTEFSYFTFAFFRAWYLVLIYFFAIYLFSITNRITFGSSELDLPIPKVLRWGLSIYRGSGRFNWIIAYAGIAFILYLGIRFLKSKHLTLILCLALALQVVDLSKPIITRFQALQSTRIQSFELNPNLTKTFSVMALNRVSLRVFPSSSMESFPTLSYLAWKNGMSTNQAQSARFNYFQSERSDKLLYQQVCTNSIPRDILVVIPQSNLNYFKNCNLDGLSSARSANLVFFTSRDSVRQ